MNNRITTTTLYERTLHVMFGTLCLFAIVYCAILLSLIFSVIERKQNTIAIRELRSELSTYETSYANQLASINELKLIAENYTKIDSSTFAVRKDPIASYSVLYAR